jgi:hypothetical protein
MKNTPYIFATGTLCKMERIFLADFSDEAYTLSIKNPGVPLPEILSLKQISVFTNSPLLRIPPNELVQGIVIQQEKTH